MLLRKVGEHIPVDFLLYIGEEGINEPAFAYLNGLTRDPGIMSNFIQNECPIYTCTVGQKFTKAKYYLEQNEINSTLKQLISVQPPVSRLDKRKIHSMANIQASHGLAFFNPQKVNARIHPRQLGGSPNPSKPPLTGLPYQMADPANDPQ